MPAVFRRVKEGSEKVNARSKTESEHSEKAGERSETAGERIEIGHQRSEIAGERSERLPGTLKPIPRQHTYVSIFFLFLFHP
ncbi:hypothetical protein [Alteribacter natronophilus]|uniref:hypothetical protein n=1 Tax=Alteribacter natronophilus TaxID=2583810 RepID=UPI00110D3405|nr:hypothetical protein [Alteribacter natronophilus]TMW72104.1 hypothetical protein FGB90_07760 [Alteribacter natronophilus]